MINNILIFIYEESSYILPTIVVSIILCSWISMFKNRDYKILLEYNKMYRNRVLKFKDITDLKYKIKQMEGREFEYFCEWLFKNIGKYRKVTLTPAANDEGRDLILVDKNNETIYVECKRYTEDATVTEDFMIGRVICQKLVGAMVVDNIEQGVIITTGNIHRNAWNYIVKLEKNTDINIEIIALDDILRMVEEINSLDVFNVVGENAR